jgi:hypothetical protein
MAHFWKMAKKQDSNKSLIDDIKYLRGLQQKSQVVDLKPSQRQKPPILNHLRLLELTVPLSQSGDKLLCFRKI